MSFQSLISYFLGVFSMPVVFGLDQKYRTAGILSFVLIAEMVCFYIHKKCKENHELEQMFLKENKNNIKIV
jgi:hypothetical protein